MKSSIRYKSKYFRKEIPTYTKEIEYKPYKKNENLNHFIDYKEDTETFNDKYQQYYFKNLKLRLTVEKSKVTHLIRESSVYTADAHEDNEPLIDEDFESSYGHWISMDLNKVIPVLEYLNKKKCYIGSHWGLWLHLNAIINCPQDEENLEILRKWIQKED